MQQYQGSCHCGAVRFTFQGEPLVKGLRCNCSICLRRGAAMSPYVIAPEHIQIEAEEGALATYSFGSCVAKHHFCKHCGIYPFHQTMRWPGHYRVNLGCVQGLDATKLPSDVFDGAAL